jgi:hypothetical protein
VGLNPGRDKYAFLLQITFRPVLGPALPYIQQAPDAVSLRVKWQVRNIGDIPASPFY